MLKRLLTVLLVLAATKIADAFINHGLSGLKHSMADRRPFPSLLMRREEILLADPELVLEDGAALLGVLVENRAPMQTLIGLILQLAALDCPEEDTTDLALCRTLTAGELKLDLRIRPSLAARVDGRVPLSFVEPAQGHLHWTIAILDFRAVFETR